METTPQRPDGIPPPYPESPPLRAPAWPPKKRRDFITPLVIFFWILSIGLYFPSCGKSQLETTSEILLATGIAIGGLQSTIIQAHEDGLISTAETRRILGICVKINEAGLEAVKITRDLHNLSQSERVSVYQIIRPIILAIDEAIALELAGIKNEELKAQVRFALSSIQITLKALEVTLAVPGEEDQDNAGRN